MKISLTFLACAFLLVMLTCDQTDAGRTANNAAYKAKPRGTVDMGKTYKNARESIQQAFGGTAADGPVDQEASRWGRNGGNPNKHRPLPEKY